VSSLIDLITGFNDCRFLISRPKYDETSFCHYGPLPLFFEKCLFLFLMKCLT